MDQTIQGNLCKGLRACGIPKRQTHQILNIVEKWLHENGAEWTNSRIKDLRQWYETTLAGDPKPPVWFRHSKTGMPVGIWKWVFDLKPAKALGVLSLNTVLYEDKLSRAQKEKFLHGLAGNKSQNPDDLERQPKVRMDWKKPEKMPEIQFPTIFDMNGSIPIHDGRDTVAPKQQLGEALKALRSSWDSLPQVTYEFLDRFRPDGKDLLGYMPGGVISTNGYYDPEKPHDRCVGRVSVLQQPQLKARIVGNPNRILQVTLEPLKTVYMTVARKLPSDVTHDQESGVRWVQDQLRQGNELAGSDLTSASDLLDVELSLALVDRVFGFPEIRDYRDYEEYFLEVSRSSWWCPGLNREVKWEQGDVLGTGPSFGLLTLTNNAAALTALGAARQDGAISKSIPWSDCFRVVGDDIVMRSPLEPYYTRVIEDLGGEINHSKTLKSNRVAEFAGRVITSDSSYLKAVKYTEPSDSSFMSYMAQLGDQAKYLLKPKQRQVYSLFKEVPGIVVNGPWMQDSYGVPLGPRYEWYLTEVQPVLETVEPDLPLEDYSMTLLKAQLDLPEANQTNDSMLDMPLVDDGYLPSQVTPAFKVGGDPRLTNGKSTLDVLYKHVRDGSIPSFSVWYEEKYGGPSNEDPSPVSTSDTKLESAEPKESTLDICGQNGSSFDDLLRRATEIASSRRSATQSREHTPSEDTLSQDEDLGDDELDL